MVHQCANIQGQIFHEYEHGTYVSNCLLFRPLAKESRLEMGVLLPAFSACCFGMKAQTTQWETGSNT